LVLQNLLAGSYRAEKGRFLPFLRMGPVGCVRPWHLWRLRRPHAICGPRASGNVSARAALPVSGARTPRVAGAACLQWTVSFFSCLSGRNA
jgi:hypothetical protein